MFPCDLLVAGGDASERTTSSRDAVNERPSTRRNGRNRIVRKPYQDVRRGQCADEQIRTIHPSVQRRLALFDQDPRLTLYGGWQHPFMLPLWDAPAGLGIEVQAHLGPYRDGVFSVMP
jgi:hypothetical protein